MNVTLLISLSVVMPARAFSSADSRRNVMPSSRAARRISDAGPPVENHFADALGEIQQFVNGAAAAESRAAAFEASGAFVERDVAPVGQSQAALDQICIGILDGRSCNAGRSRAPAAAPECS